VLHTTTPYEFVGFIREICSSHERLKDTNWWGFRRHEQGRRTGRIQEVLVNYTTIAVAMATVQEETPVPQNNGRRYKYDEKADLRLLKCVSLHGAHLAGRGQTTSFFVDFAASFNTMGTSVSSKTLWDRYKELIKDFNDKNRKELASSGIAADYSEKDQLLSDMYTAIAEKDEVDKINREVRAANERKVIAAGEAMRASALKRRSAKYQRQSIADSDGDPSRPSADASSEDGPATAPANRNRRSSSGSAASFSYDEDEQGAISELLRESLREHK
jgi:hypothetical protein